MIPLASDLLVRFRWQMRREGLLASASSPTGFRLSVAVGVSTLTFRESRGDGGSVQKSLLPWQTSHRADMLPRLDCARHAAAPGLREFVQKQCPLLAHSGHFTAEFQGPLLGVKRTLVGDAAMSAFDPRRTWTVQDCCIANWPLNPIPPVL